MHTLYIIPLPENNTHRRCKSNGADARRRVDLDRHRLPRSLTIRLRHCRTAVITPDTGTSTSRLPQRASAPDQIGDTVDRSTPPPNFRGDRTSNRSEQRFANLQRFLDAGDYSSAIELYQRIYSQHDESISGGYRSLLIAEAYRLQDANPAQGVRLLEAYLGIFYRDTEALLLLSEVKEQQGDYRGSLDRLQDAFLSVHKLEDMQAIQAQIDRVLGRYGKRLNAGKDYISLAILYRALIDRQPNHAPYYFALAHAYLSSGNSEHALDALYYIQNDSALGSQAREMIAGLERDEPPQRRVDRDVVIPLIPKGGHFVVEAQINDIPVRLMLDTGASATVIKPDALRDAGVAVDRSHPVILNTANGPVKAGRAYLSRLSLGGAVSESQGVFVLALAELTGIDGLLGMDFLSRHRFAIDHDRQELLLYR